MLQFSHSRATKLRQMPIVATAWPVLRLRIGAPWPKYPASARMPFRGRSGSSHCAMRWVQMMSSGHGVSFQGASSHNGAMLVECNFRDLVDGHYRSDAHPQALIATVASIVIDFGVPVFFCSDRQATCRFVEEYLIRFHRRIARCQKELKVPRRDSGEG